MSIKIFADGASRGNPGRAAIGAVAFENLVPSLEEFKQNEASALFIVSRQLGQKTNNEAEYLAVIAALEECQSRGIENAQVFLDSLLVVQQVNGNFKVKKEHLKPLYDRVRSLSANKGYSFAHVRREKNQVADYLANRAYEDE